MRNIAHFFAQHLRQPDRALYRHWRAERWVDVTAGELSTRIARWQAAFRREGLRSGDRIAIAARNGVDWVTVDLAALASGLVVVPAYADDNVENAAWCIRRAGSKLVVVGTSRLASAFSRPGGEQALPPCVVLEGEADGNAVTAESFLDDGVRGFEIEDVAPDALATICFTSGTVGRAKGVMLTHDNIVANVRQCESTGMAKPDDVFLSILPLSHMFERTGGYYLPLAIGAKVVFARGIAQLGEDLATQRPTVVFTVPRIVERLDARIQQSIGRKGRRRMLFDACVERGYRVAQRRPTVLDRLLAPILRRRVARGVLGRLGGRLRIAVVGGAPLDPALARTFIGLGVAMLHGYGMTEASPVIAVNREDDNRPETVGRALPGVDLRLANDGELLVRGPNVMAGYWDDPDSTRAAIDAEGYLHTGDLAEIVDGRIAIRGRVKEIFVMSNGEKLSPQDVELAILRDRLFEQAMLVGDGQPFVVLLAVTREPDERVLLRHANAQLDAFPRWARVRRVIATREPWSVDAGLVTPTLKLRRPALLQRYAEPIAAAYRDAPPEAV